MKALDTTAPAPAVSVLMAVYNGEKFLEAAVRSVLAQTFADFEMVIVDDGSSDGSRAILGRLASEDARIQLEFQTNRGITPTANRLVGLARGQFLSQLDHDDEMLPGCLAAETAHMRAHPECVALGVLECRIDGAGRVISRRRKLGTYFAPFSRRTLDARSFPPKMPFISNPASMIRASAMRGVGGYRETFAFANDNDLWFRLAEVGEIHQLNQMLLRYRRHGGNATMTRHQTIMLYDIMAHLSAAARAFGLDDAAALARFRGPGDFREAAAAYRALLGARYPVETFVHYRAVRSNLPLAVEANSYPEVLSKAFAHARTLPMGLPKLHLLRRTMRRSNPLSLRRN